MQRDHRVDPGGAPHNTIDDMPAHVGERPRHRHGDCRLRVQDRGQQLIHNAHPRLRRNRCRPHAEELLGVLQDPRQILLHQVGLVQGDDHRAVQSAQGRVEVMIALADAGRRIQQQQNQVRVGGRFACNLGAVDAPHFAKAGGVHQKKRPNRVFDDALRRAGHGAHRRQLASVQAIEERGFAAVHRADDDQPGLRLLFHFVADGMPVQRSQQGVDVFHLSGQQRDAHFPSSMLRWGARVRRAPPGRNLQCGTG